MSHILQPLRRLVLLLTAVLTLPTLADDLQRADSLLTLYNQAAPSEKINYGRELIDLYTQSEAFLDDAPVLTPQMRPDSVDLMVYYATDRFYLINAYYTEALDYNQRALDKGSQRHPDLHATLLCDRGYCFYKTGEPAQAAETEEQALHYAQQTGNQMQLSRAYLYLAIINVDIDVANRPQAKAYILKALETIRELGPNRHLHNTLGVACEVFCSAGEVDKAIEYGRQAVEAAEAIDYVPGVANHLAQLSYAYNRNKQYQLGLEAAQRAIDIVEAMPIPDRNILAISMEYKAWNLLDMGRNAEAAQLLREAVVIAQELGNTRAVCYDHRVICEALEPIDPKGALQALKRYSAMSDSMHTVQMNEALGRANAHFQNDELRAANAQSRRTNRIILVAGLIIIALLTATIAAIWAAGRQKARANAALRKMQEAREHFFTNVTHEFRTPLTVILGMSQQIQSGKTSPDELTTAAKLIERQGRQLLLLVNQLLDITKVKSAVGEQPTQTADITAYTEMMVEGFRELATQKNITLSYACDEHPVVADFVPDYYHKIVSNLLSNALKFTPEGGEVSLRLTPQQDTLRIAVADTGCGIAPEHLSRVFEPFYQAVPDAASGTGVGLALTKQIVEMLHGDISVDSETGVGTTFTVSLPLARREADVAQASAPAAPEPNAPTDDADQPSESATRILIVEDNRDVAYYIGTLLKDRYEVYHAADGKEGLAKARELMPDLIVTDLMMPHTDRLELCRQIRADELTNHIPVIVITAKATEQDRLRGLEAGADAYLYKPFNAEELYIRVDKLLERRRLLSAKFAAEPPAPAAAGEPAPTDLRQQAEARFIDKTDGLIASLMSTGQADIDHVAAALCMSPSQLRRKLTTITGTTPAQYIMNVRLQKARQLILEHPEWAIAEVAEQCGFADQPHFTRSFRRLFGITPGQFQRRGEND